MIVVTGAAGFIGSCMLSALEKAGIENLIGVDDFGRIDKNRNLLRKNVEKLIHRDEFIDWLDSNYEDVDFIFHLGARTDTTSTDTELFDRLNLEYSKAVFSRCADFDIPLIYASSAATYGMGENGYVDDVDRMSSLQPMNAYAHSKHDFDLWVMEQGARPSHWYGFKFFNVYGPNEYHKGRMASVVFHAYNQIKGTGKMKLFRSHRPDIKDGFQSRDFIYIDDVVNVMLHFYRTNPENGIFNLGTGKARPFLHLVQAVFKAMNVEEQIEYIDTPVDIRDTYQYFTEADTTHLLSGGYSGGFRSLEDGVEEYVQKYLMTGAYY